MKKVQALILAVVCVISSCISLGSIADNIVLDREEAQIFEDGREGAKQAKTDQSVRPINTVDFPDPWAGVEIDFAAVGDNLIHAPIFEDAERRGSADKRFDFLPMYEHVAGMISEADVAFINQETIMAGEKYGHTAWPTFNSPQQLGEDLVTLGFDVVNVATNHLLDKGESGYRDTLDFWHSQPITMIGGYYDKEDYENIRVTEVQGVKIAWLSYTYGTNGIFLPANSKMYVPYLYTDVNSLTGIDEVQLRADILKAEEIADVTIVSLHCGTEYTQTPTYDQKKISKLMADCGVEVILGHHSHCLQPIEWIDGANGGRTLCIYSLGNFVSGHETPTPLKMVGGIFSFRIESDGEGGLRVVNPLLTPTVMFFGANRLDTKIYLLRDYTDEIARGQGMLSLSGMSLTRAEAVQVVKDCINNEFLPEYLK